MCSLVKLMNIYISTKIGPLDRQTDRQINGQIERLTDGRTDRQTDKQIDGRTPGYTDRQTDILYILFIIFIYYFYLCTNNHVASYI